MGFFDSLVSAGKSAVKAVNDAALTQTLEQWEKVNRAPSERVRDYHDRNNQQDKNSPLKRALAIAALQDGNLFSKDQAAKKALLNLREKIAFENDQKAQSLIRAIDNLER
ncbi:hypothetical protein P3592_19440 [Vibrio parahaemolyticus]|nr:hypothetical protein [Vibrio parahaemolyticus]MDF4802990.1 hypothetical protein [Vibrio parahaemolyticus]MDF4853949.1 hypothetical protein [Vibrio parahaemolyticus]HCE4714359.1 hypothetical protein [Vibrio parahaemolyticus]HCG9795849.1 hypothetical protein [Vibrio parahaemolyticus]